MKLDKFTWGVIGVVVVLLLVAVVTVNATDGAGMMAQEYVALDTPEAPIYNAFLALQRGDLTRARSQYSAQLLDDLRTNQPGYDPFSNRSYVTSSQRLRVVRTTPAADDADRALVLVTVDTYNRGGPFGAGSTWSRDLTLEVVREPDGWKLNSQEFFY